MKKKYVLFIILIMFTLLMYHPISYAAPVINENSMADTNKVVCGNVTGIPAKIPELTSFAITVIQIAVPVILVVMGSMDLFKGVTAQKEDEIKKGQQMFVKRLIVGALIFFVIVIAKLLISVVADTSSANIIECVDCFLSNSCRK